MKKTIILTILVLNSLIIGAQSLIQSFEQVVNKKIPTSRMMNQLSSLPLTPTHEAYIGAVTVCKAQEVSNPMKMYQHFRDGTKILEKAIKRDPTNVEAIFLRHAIQTKSPSFLGYYKSRKGDRLFLKNALEQGKVKDKYLNTLIQKFLNDNML